MSNIIKFKIAEENMEKAECKGPGIMFRNSFYLLLHTKSILFLYTYDDPGICVYQGTIQIFVT